jgi:hypothetical protein
MTRDYCRSIHLGKFANCLKYHFRNIGLQTRFTGRWGILQREFPTALTGALNTCLQSDPVCDSIKPRANGLARPHVGSASREDKENCLKGILRILLVAEYALTNPEHQRPMAIGKVPECRLAPAEVSVEQLTIGFTTTIPKST